MDENSVTTPTSLTTPATILFMVQLCTYSLATLIIGYKFFRICPQSPKSYLFALRLLLLLYTCLQTAIQAYNLSSAILAHSYLTIYASLNIFCMGFDTALMLLLCMYWRRLKFQFSSSVIHQEANVSGNWTRLSKAKMTALLLWNCVFLGYFIYCLIIGQMDQWVLYGLAQTISAALLLCAILSQMRRGLILYKTFINYQQIVTSIEINTRRFLIIFSIISICSSARWLFIGYLILFGVPGRFQNLDYLLYGLYGFTFTALATIFLLIFGFQYDSGVTSSLKDSRERILSDPSKRKDSKSSRNKSSSNHETELSHDF